MRSAVGLGPNRTKESTVSPILQLRGHVSSITTSTVRPADLSFASGILTPRFIFEQPVALYPSQSLIFIGGEDGYVRAWDTHTGSPLVVDQEDPSSSYPGGRPPSGVFAMQYRDPIAGMHFSNGDGLEDDGWPALWLAAGKRVWRWEVARAAFDQDGTSTIEPH